MKSQMLILAAMSLSTAGCSDLGGADSGSEKGVVLHKTPDMRLGEGAEAVYSKTCGYCHGHNLAPIILGRGIPPEVVVAFARSGKGAMPSFRSTEITDAQLEQLAIWISKSERRKEDFGK